MLLSLKQIHQLELKEDYPAILCALEDRLIEFPDEAETVIRLGFYLWLIASNFGRLEIPEGLEQECGSRFINLYNEYKFKFSQNADFCWAFGLGMSIFWHCLPGASEEIGNSLLAMAKANDSFWRRLLGESGEKVSEEEMKAKLQGRGVLATYYGVE